MKARAYSKSVFDTLLQAYKPYLGYIIVLLFIGFVGRYLILSNAQLIGEFVDRNSVITNENLKPLFNKLLIIALISFTMTAVFRIIFSSLSALAVSRVYDETTYRVSRFPISFFESQPVGKITTRFSSDYGNVFRLFGGPLAEFLSILYDLIAISILMLLIHPAFLATIATTSIAYYFLLIRNQAMLREGRRELSSRRAPSISHFSETVQGASIIRQNRKQKTFIEKFNEYDAKYLTMKWSVFWRVTRFSLELNVLSTILFAVNGVFCIYLIQHNVIGLGLTGVVLSFTIMATQTLQMFFEWFSQFEEAFTGLEKMDEYIRLPLEPGLFLPSHSDFSTAHPKRLSNRINVSSAKQLSENLINSYPNQIHLGAEEEGTGTSSHIHVEKVSFKYPTSSHNILEGVTFSLVRGEKLGIIGRTGSGKTTLIQVLLKMYPLTKGGIFINGVNELDTEKHRSKFSVISQDQLFINGSVRDNLDLFNRKSDREIESVLKRVGLKFNVTDQIIERGQNLSYGEKQLLSLARGLLQNAEIFIFDEATSNVDPQSESLMNRALKDLLSDKTQIRIAHRLQTVEDCDSILWLDAGKIKMYGPTQETLENFRNSR